MTGLIREIGTSFARYIEAGSPLHAFIGGIVGVGLAAGLTAALFHFEVIEHWGQFGIVSTLASALAGALIGSRVWNSNAQVNISLEAVNVWNLNSALAAPVLILVCGGGFGVLMLVLESKNRVQLPWGWVVLLGSISISGLTFAFSVCGVQLGKVVRVRSLFRGREYPIDRVRRWGFGLSRGEYVTTPQARSTEFLIQFDDGYSLLLAVSPPKAQQIAAVMSQLGRYILD